MSTESLALAIDGGGTSTSACLTRSNPSGDATILGKATADQSNPAVVGFACCRDNVIAAARAAIADSQLESGLKIQRIAVGLAGLEATDFHDELKQSVAQAIPSDAIQVMTDIELLLLAATGKRATVGVISGTGSVAVGKSMTGETSRAGGRGFLTGDGGSGFWIGQQGITAALRALDNFGPPTELVRLIGDKFSTLDPSEWTQAVYSAGAEPRTVVAGCTPLVFEAAQLGDEVAVSILNAAGSELAQLVTGVCRQLQIGANDYDAVVAGSVLTKQSVVRTALTDRLADLNFPAAALLLVEEPAVDVAKMLANASRPF